MKRSLNIAAALALLASPALAQHLYDPENLTSACVQNPYALTGYAQQPVPTTVVGYPLFESFAARYSVAQAAVGTSPETERAYLVISNLEGIEQTVAVRLTVDGISCPLQWQGTVPANGRRSLSLHSDPSLAGRPWNFSVAVYFSLAGGDADVVNYDGRQRETGTKPGKAVGR